MKFSADDFKRLYAEMPDSPMTRGKPAASTSVADVFMAVTCAELQVSDAE